MPRPKTAAQTLCEPEHWKFTSKFHKSHFLRKFTGKMPRPSPERRQTLRVRLSNRNVLGDFTWATLYINLQEKCRGPAGAPWSTSGIYNYRKNPSMWTDCLGKNWSYIRSMMIFWTTWSSNQVFMYDVCSRSLSFRLDDILITFHHDVNGKIVRMWANIPSGKKLLCSSWSVPRYCVSWNSLLVCILQRSIARLDCNQLITIYKMSTITLRWFISLLWKPQPIYFENLFE